MKLHLIMPASPVNRKQIDSAYEAEYNAAKELTSVHLLDTHNLSSFNIVQGNNTKLIYHGWMMTLEQYEAFYNRLSELEYELISSPKQYLNCHYFDHWYSVIEDKTPRSIIVPISSVRDMMMAVKQFMKDYDCAVIIKDFVKSVKHSWHEACFIPKDADPFHIAKIISAFMAAKSDDIQGDLVVRQFVELKQIGEHNKSKMPLYKEFRSFVLNGKVIHTSRYWEQGAYDQILPPQDFIDKIAEKVFSELKSNLFTIDTAQLNKDDSWTCIEIGDGQVSSIPEQEDRKEFFIKLLTE
jgi:ATP-grasp domain, R2K clade family 2